MKLIRLAVISIVLLFVLATLLGALLPSMVLVSRAVNVNAPRHLVLPYVSDIRRWKEWIEGMQDTSVTIYSPVNADLGGTSVRITHISDSAIISSWITRNGHPQTSTLRLIGDSSQKVTVVQWQFEQKLKWYPWEKLGSMMNDKILGPRMEKNLNSLKSLVEKK